MKRLEQKEVNCFLPLMETWSKRLDRRKKIHLPFFPGYVFVHVLLDNYVNLTIVKTPGALNLLRNSEGPLSIPSYQIENLQTMINSTQPLKIHPYLKEGEWVQVVRGPLAGCIGILNRMDPKRGRLIVSVDIIKKSVSVELDLEDVELTLPPTSSKAKVKKRQGRVQQYAAVSVCLLLALLFTFYFSFFLIPRAFIFLCR